MSEPSETLVMAYADAELDDAAAAEIEQAMMADPALTGRVVAYLKSRRLARSALGLEGRSEVPPALAEALDAAARKGPARDRGVGTFRYGTWAVAAAASVAIVIGVAAFTATGPGGNPISGPMALLVEATGGAVLGTTASGDTARLDSGTVRPTATFHAGEALCREFRADPLAGPAMTAVSCRQESAWQLVFLEAASSPEEAYVPASGTESLDAFLAALGADAPLDPEAEAAALQSLD